MGRNDEKFSGLIADAATVEVSLINEKFVWGYQIFLKV